jgi:hypothetical protein
MSGYLELPAAGDAPVALDLWLPVANALATVIEFVDADGDPLDIEADTWTVLIFQPSDPDWAGWEITPTVAVGTMTLTASASTAAEELGDRGHLRWVVRNESVGQDILAGAVRRSPRGAGVRWLGTDPVTVLDSTVTVQVGDLVISGQGDIDGGDAASVFAGDIDGGDA